MLSADCSRLPGLEAMPYGEEIIQVPPDTMHTAPGDLAYLTATGHPARTAGPAVPGYSGLLAGSCEGDRLPARLVA